MNINDSLKQIKLSSLNEVAEMPFNDFLEKAEFYQLDWQDTQVLYDTAIENQNRLRKTLTRANPEINIGRIISEYKPPTEKPTYDSSFLSLQHGYAVPGTAASMFSAPAYLYKLYHEARALHAHSSDYHLDKRRPDLKTLELSQENMDQEVSTLTLSNDILLQKLIEKREQDPSADGNKGDIYEYFSTKSDFHYAKEIIYQVLHAREINVKRLMEEMPLAKEIDQDILLCTELTLTPLRLNSVKKDIKKIASYYKERGLSAKIMDPILGSSTLPGSLILEKLNKIARIKKYQDRYNIPEEQAFILENNSILTTRSQHDPRSPSQFDQLFNSPPLKGVRYELTGVERCTDDALEAEEAAVLRQALAVDKRGLSIMREMLTSDTTVSQITYLSALYRIRLLARVHGLTVSELAILLKMLGNLSENPITFSIEMSDDRCAALMEKLYQLTYWLREQGWRVNELYDMTTTEYNGEKTPEIEALINTIAMGLDWVPAQAEPETAIQVSEQIAPFIASSLELSSETVACCLLNWLDKLIPQTAPDDLIINVNTFRDEIIKWNQDHREINEKVIIFCQRLQQLAFIYRRLQLSEAELSLFVEQPHCLDRSLTLIKNNITDLQLLTRVHRQITSFGDHASQVLMALKQRNLTADKLTDRLALTMQTDIETLQQAANLADYTDSSPFIDILSIIGTVQWLNTAQWLNIDTNTLRQLIDLNALSTYQDWQAVATALLTGLNKQQAEKVNIQLDEGLSTALSEHSINFYSVVDEPRLNTLTTRDYLYQYLLIDNQISAEVKTSKIAAAIAALQLYINRTLQRQEKAGLNTDILNKPFFQNWESINCRYSTWAATAKLRYQPENYIDPLQRLGQSQMMDNFQQAISETQLNNEVIEQAFKAYLTEFEQIANLSIISAYHDNVNSNEGLTYFVGENPDEKGIYYWRHVDQKQFSKGKFFIGAWGQWKKIDCAVNSMDQLIRPVVYQSRLYLVWIEKRQETEIDQDDDKKSNSVNKYKLNVAHHRYDGNWSSSIEFPIEFSQSGPGEKAEELFFNDKAKVGIYCAEDIKNKKIAILFYKKGEKNIKQGFFISDEMVCDKIENSALQIHFDSIKNQLDTDNTIKVNKCYSSPYHYAAEINGQENTVNHNGFSLIVKNSLPSIKIGQIHETLKIFFRVGVSVAYQGGDPHQTELMKLLSPHGGEFALSTLNDQVTDRPMIKVVISLDKMKIGIYHYFHASDVKIEFYRQVTEKVEHLEVTTQKIIFRPVMLKALYSIYDVNEFMLDPHFAIDVEGTPENKINFLTQSFSYFVREGDEKDTHLNLVQKMIRIDTRIHGIKTSFNDKKENNAVSFNEKNNRYQTDEISIGVAAITSDTAIQVPFEVKIGTTPYTQNLTIPITYRAVGDNKIFDLHKDVNGVQYMKYSGHRVHLNTRFAKKLTSLANRSIDAVLNLDTQKQEDISGQERIEFRGANALYFWELFYYLPMMVMQRLLQEQHFSQASRWLKYVYHPAGYIKAPARHIGRNSKTEYWNVLPLQDANDGRVNNLENSGGTDPDAIAQADPLHYRIATFMRYLDLLLKRGDHAYRQLERDTLVEAQMWYMQALDVLGEEPEPNMVIWQNPTLDPSTRPAQQAERSAPSLSMTTSEIRYPFYPQENIKLRSYWPIFKRRLYNLRHNLTIDGIPLPLPLYTNPLEPSVLRGALFSSPQDVSSIPTQDIEPRMLQRFPQMLNHARGMVSQLMQFGATLLNVIERKDAEALNALLQTQAKALMVTSIQLQDKTQAELQEELTALNSRLTGTRVRFEHYHNLYERNITQGEQSAMDLRTGSSSATMAAQTLHMTAAGLAMAPNIFGLSNGGMRWGALATGMAQKAEMVASGLMTAADRTSQFEMYRRRREEWDIQRESARLEIDQLTAQINGLNIRIQAADMQKKYLEMQQAHIQDQLSLLQSKFSNQKLYSWLRGQLMTIYQGFYDQTLSRCHMAERAWLWETGKDSHKFIKAGVWQDTYAGLLSGEKLMLNLATMETAYLYLTGRFYRSRR
ncbi:neuraminidase-like domain-containing protein [Candidatus Fukatsuia symbiotica]|uniref:Toxin n=2 Tax=Candidatus Fukatsuia TaxID=1927833 RepID=A0A2U8I380_9GAMM|nr:neuraminidase-like domain-containing protein [Candidatus Fukatsuia symbiotica]AWK13559.1 hypothetical protein CCS41_02040 [Candidatus Fukatsuia symbiotica]MEA9445352.1 neuraminidase-like domain-containing protein [Candidatus Fukatsuia symbiotica]